jgi:hypothetical protein
MSAFLWRQENDVFLCGAGSPVRIIHIHVCHSAQMKIFRVNAPPNPAKDKVRAKDFHLHANPGVFVPHPLFSCVAGPWDKIGRIDKASPRKFPISCPLHEHRRRPSSQRLAIAGWYVHFASPFYIIIYCYSLIYFIFRDDTFVISSILYVWWLLEN